MSLFFETTTAKHLRSQDGTDLDTRENFDPINSPFAAGPNPFDGVPDYVRDRRNFNTFDDRADDADSFYVAYGMDIVPNILSLGLAIDLSSWDSSWKNNDVERDNTIEYDPADHTVWESSTDDRDQIDNGKHDEDQLDVTIGTHWRPTADLKLRANLAYLQREESNNGLDNYLLTHLDEESTGANTLRSYNDNDVWNADTDLNGWGIELIPTWQVNANIMLRFDLRYHDMDGDSKRNNRAYDTDLHSQQNSASDPVIITYDREFEEIHRWSGDVEESGYLLGPKVYFTYGAAQFSLGVTYENEEIDRDERTVAGESRDTRRYYDNITGDLTSSSVRVRNFDIHVDSDSHENETWSFPVATLVKLSDKWTFRAGAEYTQVNSKSNNGNVRIDGGQSITTTYDADGLVTGTDANDYYINEDGDTVPYERDSRTETYAYNTERTRDFTTYRLGLGYQMTEHVNLDLAFEGNTGAVETDEIFASITFAF